MISYENYKTLHIFLILCSFGSIGFIACETSLFLKKWGKILLGLLSFLILVSGMGLFARLGAKHADAFPLWLKLKVINWLLINILFIGLFKVKTKEYRTVLMGVLLLVAWFSIWIAIYKPL